MKKVIKHLKEFLIVNKQYNIIMEKDFNRKVQSNPQQACFIANSWKKNNIVAFTNGCFDLMHYGHIKYLQEIKSHCSKLIVGINTDESVKNIKGGSRPIMDMKSRVAVLASLEFVDMVIPFNEVTPIRLIRDIEPNILAKGGDYKSIEDIVGHEIVIENGGTVLLLDLEKGYSTTNIIEKIKESC